MGHYHAPRAHTHTLEGCENTMLVMALEEWSQDGKETSLKFMLLLCKKPEMQTWEGSWGRERERLLTSHPLSFKMRAGITSSENI